jgi:hypothetical protein
MATTREYASKIGNADDGLDCPQRRTGPAIERRPAPRAGRLVLWTIPLFLLVSPSSANWFRRGSDKASERVEPRRNVVNGVLDDSQSERFMSLADARRGRENEAGVLRDVLVEKARETQRLNDELRARFMIDPDEVYTFNPSNRVIFRVAAESDEAAEAAHQPPDPSRARSVAHFQLQEPEKVDLFLRLVKARDLTRTQMSVLLLLVREKEMELEAVVGRLKNEFGIEPGKHYRFDAAKKKLIELPSGPVR